MPCDASYMEPTPVEKARKEAAELLVWLNSKLKIKSPKALVSAAEDYYGAGYHAAPELCELLSKMDAECEAIVYNGRDKMARRLADWWEEHQQLDAEQRKKEKKARERKDLVDSAKKKLTKAELSALKEHFRY